jgi:WD40 repeat protein
MAELLPNLIQQFLDTNGNPLVGGSLYSYAAGTSTPLATYTDQTQGTPNANPTVLDSTGSASVWIPISTGYKFILKDASGNTITTKDNVFIVETGSIGAGAIAAGAITTSLIAAGAITSTLIQSGAVTTTKLANSAVTGSKIATGTIEVGNIDPTIDLTSLDNMIEVVFQNCSDLTGSVIEAVPQYPWTSPNQLAPPTTLPTGVGNGCAFSPDGRFLAVAEVPSPYAVIYERIGSTFTALSTPGTTPTGVANGVAWSPKGDFLSYAHTTTPFVTNYLRQGNTFTKLNDPESIPPGNGFSCAWSPNGEYFAHGSATTPFVTMYQVTSAPIIPLYSGGNLTCTTPNTANPQVASATHTFTTADIGLSLQISSGAGYAPGVYRITGNSGSFAILDRACGLGSSLTGGVFAVTAYNNQPLFTALSAPLTLPGGTVYSMAFSPDNQFLACISQSAPYLTIYQISGTTFTYISSPTLPAAGQSVKFSPSGQFLSVGLAGSPYLAIYQVSGVSFTHLASTPAVPPTSIVTGIAWSPNSLYMALALNSSPYVLIYQVSSLALTFTALSAPGSLPTSASGAIAWGPTGQFLATVNTSTPYIFTYQSASILPTDALLWVRNLSNV